MSNQSPITPVTTCCQSGQPLITTDLIATPRPLRVPAGNNRPADQRPAHRGKQRMSRHDSASRDDAGASARVRLPEIVWMGPPPRSWRLPKGAVGWGLTHSAWHRMGQLSHMDWVPIMWTDDNGWLLWSTIDAIPLFVDPSLVDVLTAFDKVHSTGQPGRTMILRESMDLELHLGCVW